LDGIISEEQNRLTAAIAILKRAVILEDSMIYDEPKDWMHRVRQYLGNVLFKKKKYTEAERVKKEDLKINPNNGWSLTGL
jgi:tetratricopeptide (TPR) repeat protein